MKVLSNPTTQALLILLLLSFYGVSLAKDVATLQDWRRQLDAEKDANSRLAYGKGSGITVDGVVIRPERTPLPL
jgi:hypothetical protein